MDCTHWGPHMHWFWVMPLVFMILMFIFIAFMMRRAGDWRGGRGGAPWSGWGISHGPSGSAWSAETPRQILDRRYASGELTKEQYDQMKRDIELDRSQA